MKRLIIDTDPGVDDAHAILLTLAHPDVQVEAITTVNGNVNIDLTTANALKILDIAEKHVPVYRGCDRPLINRPVHAAYVHGADGLGDCGIPASNKQVQAEHAVNALIRLANENPGELTLVAMGPLTNLALALSLDPNLPAKFKQLVVMGGAIYSKGNAETITAEFNIHNDPEAAHIVFSAWPMLSLLSWETTMAHVFTNDELQRFFNLGTPRAKFFHDTSQKFLNFIRERWGQDILFAPDGLALAVAIEPEIVTSSEKKHISIELHGSQTRGQTVVDWYGRTQNPPNTEIILDLDQNRFIQLMENGLR
jgi:inosine-uridine nucleoside N-ribohydrolase